MIRRTCIVSIFIFVVIALLAAPALAYGPMLPVPVDAGARLVAGTSDATCMWSESGGTTLKAAREPLSAGSVQGPYTVVSGITSPGAWSASGDGLFVTVLWKDGATVYVKRFDLSTGADVYSRVAVCTDAQAAALPGSPGTSVVPAGISADGSGGAYIWCTVSPGPATGGYTLLNHVSATGVLATTSPVMKVVARNVVALDSDDAGDACALLSSGTGVTVDRYGPDLTGVWAGGARNPYLIQPVPAPTMTAVGLVATDEVFVAWREGGKVMVQEFALNGDRVFPGKPPGVAIGVGDLRIATDESGGAYVVGPSNDGVVAKHLVIAGRIASWGSDALSLGLTTPRVDAVTSNRAGDLFVTYSDAAGASADTSGAALMTYLGSWSDLTPGQHRSAQYTGAVPDGVGGAYIVGSGADAQLWRISSAADQLTFRPHATLYQYGDRDGVTVGGYSTIGGLPVPGAVGIGTMAGGQISVQKTAQAGEDGFYTATLKPAANAVWSAHTSSFGDQVQIRVMPRVTLALSFLKSPRPTEIFSGAVGPNHRGSAVYVQKAVGSGWRTIAGGKLDRSSRYRIAWTVPFRRATYKLRTIIKKHADHAQGASPTRTLKVVIR
jgi:hypothetical protein